MTRHNRALIPFRLLIVIVVDYREHWDALHEARDLWAEVAFVWWNEWIGWRS